jgi:hypothetical protein
VATLRDKLKWFTPSAATPARESVSEHAALPMAE